MITAPESRRLPVAQGWRWIAEGWRLLMLKPLTWIVFTLLTWAIVSLSALHPLLIAAVAVLMPVLLGGWVIACREADAGRSIPVTLLFAAFRERLGDLAAIGGVHLMGNVLLALVLLALGGDLFTDAISHPESVTADQARELQSRMSIALIIMLAIAIPLASAVWFAPLGVVLHRLRTPQALLASLRGILRNSLPFLFYTLILSVLAVILFELGAILGLPWRSAMELAFWVLMPLLVTSVYASYREIFGDPPEPAPAPDR